MSAADDVRRLALQLPDVTERPSYGTPAFYVGSTIFARIHEDADVLVCWQGDLSDRDALIHQDPDVYFTTDHYHDHASVLVRLPLIDLTHLDQLLRDAWRARAPRRLLDE